jgi:NADH:ubiquinone oxidoreductase subunit F (NADH-binding)
VLVGGYHGTWIRDSGDLVVTRPALRAARTPLNAGVLARLPHESCALRELASVVAWLAGQSAGQCGPCYFGLPLLAHTLAQLAAGAPLEAHARGRAELLRGRGACAHPDGVATFVDSALDVLAPEIADHRTHGHCGRQYLGALPTGRAS